MQLEKPRPGSMFCSDMSIYNTDPDDRRELPSLVDKCSFEYGTPKHNHRIQMFLTPLRSCAQRTWLHNDTARALRMTGSEEHF